MQPQGNGSRRTRVKRHPGIYYREGADGKRRYEVTFLDSDGRRRWQTIDGGLDDAQAALETVRGKLRRGEKVAPSKATFRDVADAWIESQSQLRPRTKASYKTHLRLHAYPRLGRLRIAEIDEDDIAALIAEMQAKGRAGWTIRSALTPVGRVLSHAARRGLIGSNPMGKLERGERPAIDRREMRILERDEIARVLDAASPMYRAMLATGIFTGLRQGELLGLKWGDVDFKSGVVRVRRALDRAGNLTKPKTPRAIRDVTMFPALAQLLREHRAASAYSRDEHFVFSTRVGTPIYYRNASGRGLEKALQAAGLGSWVEEDGKRRWRGACRFHDLRHTFASLLIAQGENVVYVSRQLGHAGVDITLRTYAHLFDAAEHAQRASDRMEASFGNLLETSGGDRWPNLPSATEAEVVALQGFRD